MGLLNEDIGLLFPTEHGPGRHAPAFDSGMVSRLVLFIEA
jgi:hypothetical protein